jgi:hypothetical protein
MWSIGCILGEMILKKAIFPGATTVEQIELIMGTIEQPLWSGMYFLFFALPGDVM